MTLKLDNMAKIEFTKKEFDFLCDWLGEDLHLEEEKEVNDSLNPRSPIVVRRLKSILKTLRKEVKNDTN